MQILHKTSPERGRPVAIYNLERRMDAAESDIKQIKGGMNYLVKQFSEPSDPPRCRIGFNADGEQPSKPYGKR